MIDGAIRIIIEPSPLQINLIFMLLLKPILDPAA
jgi:hypothetical protein